MSDVDDLQQAQRNIAMLRDELATLRAAMRRMAEYLGVLHIIDQK